MIHHIKNFFFDERHKEERNLVDNDIHQNMTTQTFEQYFEPFFRDSVIRYNKSIISSQFFEDLEIFSGYREDSTKSVFDSIDKTKLNGSKILLTELLKNPLYDSELLNSRQKALQEINIHRPYLSSTLQEMSHYERDILWLFQDKDLNLKTLYEIVYFRFWLLKKCNNIDYALTGYNIYRIILSPIIGLLSPITYFVIPYYILRFKYKFKISFTKYLRLMFDTSKLLFASTGNWTSNLRYCSYLFSLIFYFQSIFNSFEISTTLWRVTESIVNKMSNISKFINNSIDIIHTTEIDNTHIQPFFKFSENIDVGIKPPEILNRHFMLTNFGTHLKFFKTLDIHNVKKLLYKIYIIDCLNSLNSLTADNGFSYVHYDSDTRTPCIESKSIWHPCLSANNVVMNDIHLSKDNKHMLITGPNAGGKSTFVKSNLINVLFSQTLTISNSEYTKITPFYYISCHINIPDCKGRESLFEAEMNRCKDNLEILKSLTENQYGFVVMDEILSSTNALEGISGSYAILKKLAEYQNLLTICTTHYTYLTKLEKRVEGFKNYKVSIEKTDDKDIKFTYKVTRGISKQFIALELLEKNGFDSDIIDDAKKIRDRFCV